MKVTQSPISLQDLLIEYSVFKVPRYQREYSWDNQQFSDLFYDITYSDEDYGHFFGSILIYCDSEKKATAEIIDGQQRLTTFFLLLKAIKDVLTEYQTTTTKIEKRVKIAIEDERTRTISDNISERSADGKAIVHNDIRRTPKNLDWWETSTIDSAIQRGSKRSQEEASGDPMGG